MKAVAFALLGFTRVALAAEPLTVELVDAPSNQRVHLERLGINANYLLDAEAVNPPNGRPLAEALREMGVRWIRYPGGEKSDNYLWATPPGFSRPAARPATTGPWDWPAMDTRRFTHPDRRTFRNPVLEFDAFIHLCRQIGARPIVVVNHDSVVPSGGAPGKHESLPRDLLVRNAASWVAYARRKGYAVRNWEVGNESYFNDRIPARTYARNLREFASAMRRADPLIRIGANTPDWPNLAGKPDRSPWLETLLRHARGSFDFLSMHIYPCYRWMSYRAYAHRLPDIDAHIDETRRALAKWGGPNAASTPIALTETNSADWFGHPRQSGWKHRSNIGHGLVLFDLLGTALRRNDLEMVLVWNTRWLNNARNPELWDALDAKNNLLPTGRAMALWARHAQPLWLDARAPDSLRVFATTNANRTRLTVFILTRGSRTQHVVLDNPIRGEWHWTLRQWRGRSPNDPKPRWTPTPTPVDLTRPVRVHPYTLLVLEARR
ncbi:MAG: hypothetical protein SFU53_08180 [Terrimicrobiaceae bacterium]|nr:hypothetical protein [Terrimicrobiaceae bacterium]